MPCADLASLDQEHFIVLAIARGAVVARQTIAIGTATSCTVSPRDLFRAVLLAGGSHFVVVHNHPSGDPTPSAEDLALTRQIADGAKLLGLALLDHVIVATRGHYSFRAHGNL